jgi:hypothetical protein
VLRHAGVGAEGDLDAGRAALRSDWPVMPIRQSICFFTSGA